MGNRECCGTDISNCFTKNDAKLDTSAFKPIDWKKEHQDRVGATSTSESF